MKVKLLTIGILALLLCAMVPMTAAAAPANTIKAPLYTYDEIAGIKGAQVGTVTLNTATGKLSASASGLDPTITTYKVVIFSIVHHSDGSSQFTSAALTGDLTPTANGHLKTSVTLGTTTLNTVNTLYIPYTYAFGIVTF